MQPAPDENWIDTADELYLQVGSSVELDRPIFQGDVFVNVPMIKQPMSAPKKGTAEHTVRLHTVMVVPHPCQCYHGDSLRPFLTVAPAEKVKDFSRFGTDHTRSIDKFPLHDVPIRSEVGEALGPQNMVADFGRLQSIPSGWLNISNRVACLSHRGLGLLGRRVLSFQMRMPITLANAMAFTQTEWEESYIMQAWIRANGSLAGYSDWSSTPQVIRGVNGGEPIAPHDVRATARDVLIELISGEATVEPTEGTGGRDCRS